MAIAQAFLLAIFACGSYAQFSSSVGASSSPSTTAPPATTQTTVNLFIGTATDEQLAVSVVAADSCETTIALVCTKGNYGSGELAGTCDPNQTVRRSSFPLEVIAPLIFRRVMPHTARASIA